MADVAVVIPCYNASRVIGRALASVMEQSDPPREIVVVDDGSDDCAVTQAIVAGMHGKIPIEMISLRVNRGASVARNRGVARSRAEYIAFLDADDVWHPRKIELQRDAMSRERWVICGHGYVHQMDGPRQWTALTGAVPVVEVSVGAFIARNPFHTPTVMVRRSEFAGFDESLRRNDDFKAWVLTYTKSAGRGGYLKAALAGGFKPPLGASGLSAAVGEMHRTRIAAIRSLGRESRAIPRSFVACAWAVEQVKYPLRVARLSLRRCLSQPRTVVGPLDDA
jgi:glycosyltransferase involved in cell wall biosynthesis